MAAVQEYLHTHPALLIGGVRGWLGVRCLEALRAGGDVGYQPHTESLVDFSPLKSGEAKSCIIVSQYMVYL